MVNRETNKRRKRKSTVTNLANLFQEGIRAKAQYPPHAETDYYWDLIFAYDEEYLIPHPNKSLHLRRQIESLCRKSLSTKLVNLLETLYPMTDDVILRRALAKKAIILRRDYLDSYREYSDHALIRLTEREKLFDKWEGFYILGCFASKRAIPYLRKRLAVEKNQLLSQAINRSIHKIETTSKKRIQERGF